MQPLLNRLRSLRDRVLQGAFPDDSHAPAESMEHFRMAPVASDVSLEFLLPELFIGPGSGCVAAAFMSVPEAAVDEHHCSALREYKVGGAGQSPHMKSISKTPGERRVRSIRSGRVFFPRMPDIMRLRCGVVGTRIDVNIPPGCLRRWQLRAAVSQCEWMKATIEAEMRSLPCA